MCYSQRHLKRGRPNAGRTWSRPGPCPPKKTTVSRDYTPPLMLAVPAVLLAGSIVLGLIPGLVPGIETAAPRFAPVANTHVEAFDYLYGAAGTLGAVAIAGLTLFAPTLHRRLPRAVTRPIRRSLATPRRLHSGHIGDYIARWTTAAAMLSGAALILLT